MLHSIPFKTSAGNNYLFSYTCNEFNLIHPILSFFVQKENDGYDVEKYYKDIRKKRDFKIENTTYTQNEIAYYFGKYKFFKEYKLLNSVRRNNFILSNATSIKQGMINNIDIVFEVTDRCNLSCVYCSYGGLYKNYDKRSNKTLSFNKAKRIIDFTLEKTLNNLQGFPIKILVGFYGGEPLLEFKLIEKIVKYTKVKSKNGISFEYGMTTNGLLLNRHIDFLVKNDFSLSISLDGNDQHNSYRVFKEGRSSFNALFSVLKKIQKEHSDFFTKKISFLTVVSNKSSLGEINAFFEQEFNKKTSFSEIALDNTNPMRKDELMKLHKSIADLKIEEKAKKTRMTNNSTQEILTHSESLKLIDIAYRLSGNLFDSYIDLLDHQQKSQSLPTGTCLPFSKKIFVTVNGKMLPCERISHDFYFGMVNENGVDVDLNKAAEKMNNYYQKIEKYCKNCYMAKICDECMFSIQDIDTNPKCEYFSNMNQFQDILQEHYELLEKKPHAYKRIFEETIIS